MFEKYKSDVICIEIPPSEVSVCYSAYKQPFSASHNEENSNYCSLCGELLPRGWSQCVFV